MTCPTSLREDLPASSHPLPPPAAAFSPDMMPDFSSSVLHSSLSNLSSSSQMVRKIQVAQLLPTPKARVSLIC